MLVASGELFFQLIEGPDAAIDALFARIIADDRHRNVTIVGVEQGDVRRMCPDWSYGPTGVLIRQPPSGCRPTGDN